MTMLKDIGKAASFNALVILIQIVIVFKPGVDN
jgi:hypothetical protein